MLEDWRVGEFKTGRISLRSSKGKSKKERIQSCIIFGRQYYNVSITEISDDIIHGHTCARVANCEGFYDPITRTAIGGRVGCNFTEVFAITLAFGFRQHIQCHTVSPVPEAGFVGGLTPCSRRDFNIGWR